MYLIPNSLKYRSNSATYCALPYFYIISLKAYLVPSMTSFSNRKAVKAKVHSFMPKASLHLRLALSLLCHLQLNGIFSGGAIHNFVNIVTIRYSRNGILLKFSFSEKATKIWKNLPLALTLLSKNNCSVKLGGRFFSNLWPSHNVWALSTFHN